MLLYLIRHGDPDYEHDSLTALGRKQAAACAERMAEAGIDEIYASPCGRAKVTASYTCQKLGKEMTIVDMFHEGTAWDRFHTLDDDGVRKWAFFRPDRMLATNKLYETVDSFNHGFFEDDEGARRGWAQMCRDLDSFIASLGYERIGEGNGYRAVKPNDKKIAVFCHQGAGLHVISHLMNLPIHLFTPSFDISHTGVSIIRFNGDKIVYPQLLCLSDLSHLYKTGLPMRYHNLFDI